MTLLCFLWRALTLLEDAGFTRTTCTLRFLFRSEASCGRIWIFWGLAVVFFFFFWGAVLLSKARGCWGRAARITVNPNVFFFLLVVVVVGLVEDNSSRSSCSSFWTCGSGRLLLVVVLVVVVVSGDSTTAVSRAVRLLAVLPTGTPVLVPLLLTVDRGWRIVLAVAERGADGCRPETLTVDTARTAAAAVQSQGRGRRRGRRDGAELARGEEEIVWSIIVIVWVLGMAFVSFFLAGVDTRYRTKVRSY